MLLTPQTIYLHTIYIELHSIHRGRVSVYDILLLYSAATYVIVGWDRLGVCDIQRLYSAATYVIVSWGRLGVCDIILLHSAATYVIVGWGHLGICDILLLHIAATYVIVGWGLSFWYPSCWEPLSINAENPCL